MGLVKALTQAVSTTLADQWVDTIQPAPFGEHDVIVPGLYRQQGSQPTTGVLTNGSAIYIPERTAAFVFNQGGIEEVISEPGRYEYYNYNTHSALDGSGKGVDAVVDEVRDRVMHGGQATQDVRVAFVNLREIRDLKFGTASPIIYHDHSYDADLEVTAYGTMSVRVSDPELFVRNYLPPNESRCSFDDDRVYGQILSEFMHSLRIALSSMSDSCSVSQLPSQADKIAELISTSKTGAGSWPERFGIELVRTAILGINLTPDSRRLIEQISAGKASGKSTVPAGPLEVESIPLQQTGAARSPRASSGGSPENKPLPYEEQIELVKKLKDLLDAGVLDKDEFEAKKQEIMGV